MLYSSWFLPLAEDGQEKPNEDAPENNPQYTTVYVGNLAPEARLAILTFSITIFGALST